MIKSYVAFLVALFAFAIMSIIAPPARAEAYKVLNYNENVRIVVAQKECRDGKKVGYVAVAQRRDNQFLRGCATDAGKGQVKIQWEGKDADSSTFDASRFYDVDAE